MHWVFQHRLSQLLKKALLLQRLVAQLAVQQPGLPLSEALLLLALLWAPH
ncbi:hypothetical protein [Vibrio fluvialis]|nr:hypothetical protein [Vibrio fluvialis]MCE7623414.1 hypothetical protein [Vibrio fluvialis]